MILKRLFCRRSHSQEGQVDAAASPELERAREATRESVQRAQRDLDEQRLRLNEAENLRTLVRRLHARNHIAEDISRLIQGGPQREGRA